MLGTALKFFLVVLFLRDDTETPYYYGPFENEEACWSFDYLQKSGVLYIGVCRLMDEAIVPRRLT